MRVVYLAHPLGAGAAREPNRRAAARWVAWATRTHAVAVIADWIILSGELPETPANHALGLAADLALVARADELWLVGGRVSPGMQMEADEARRRGIPVIDLTELGALPPATHADDPLEFRNDHGSGCTCLSCVERRLRRDHIAARRRRSRAR
jgi:hypothetical protein